MKIICTNIGPAEFGGQIEWDGPASNFSRTADLILKTAYNEDGTTRDREEDGHNFVYQLDDQDRRDLCRNHIFKYYPDWKQLDIMRRGTKEANDKMNTFIDTCRDWSNDSTNNDPFGLEGVEP